VDLRILFLGENWFGSCARACAYALRRANCDVLDIDLQTFIPQWRRKTNRAVLRMLRGRIVREYNDHILAEAAHFAPDILLAFKGSFVERRTLELLRERQIALYNYYPDTSPTAHDALLADSIRAYDCVFYTKNFWTEHRPDVLAGCEAVFLPHGYDADVHRPLQLSENDMRQYGHDVTVIASHTSEKERLLTRLVQLMPGLDLHVYGDRWMGPSRAPELKPFLKGVAIFGDRYARAIQAAKINLAILSGKVQGVMQGDETTTRTYEIPACGGFMLHERTPELLELYEEGREVAAFETVEELAAKIEYYLAHPAERESIARAGHDRCVPAYSYDRRVDGILAYFGRSMSQQSEGTSEA